MFAMINQERHVTGIVQTVACDLPSVHNSVNLSVRQFWKYELAVQTKALGSTVSRHSERVTEAFAAEDTMPPPSVEICRLCCPGANVRYVLDANSTWQSCHGSNHRKCFVQTSAKFGEIVEADDFPSDSHSELAIDVAVGEHVVAIFQSFLQLSFTETVS